MILRSCVLSDRRSGFTLTEALIAIGVLTIGLLALLSLFPFGAVQMAQAVKDDRTTQVAVNADNMFRLFWRETWLDNGDNSSEAQARSAGKFPAIDALDNNGGGGPTYDATVTNPSWPLLIDPVGKLVGQSPWVAALPGYVRRESLSSIGGVTLTTVKDTIRLTSILDDVSYSANGIPDTSAGSIERGARYNCSWLIQRPKNNRRDEVNVNIIVYQNRPASIVQTAETSFNLASAPGPGSSALVLTSATRPPIRKGSWILFAYAPQATPVPGAPNYPIADFYRVMSMSDGPTNYIIDLQYPIRVATQANGSLAATIPGVVFVLDNVAEVFDRGTLTPFSPPTSVVGH